MLWPKARELLQLLLKTVSVLFKYIHISKVSISTIFTWVKAKLYIGNDVLCSYNMTDRQVQAGYFLIKITRIFIIFLKTKLTRLSVPSAS